MDDRYNFFANDIILERVLAFRIDRVAMRFVSKKWNNIITEHHIRHCMLFHILFSGYHSFVSIFLLLNIVREVFTN